MKNTLLRPLCGLLLASALIPGTHAQGTAFTYQGRLTDSTGLATGTYDLQFSIHDAASGGHVLAGPILVSPVRVTDGLFTAALDFGANAFTGEPRWLEIAVRTNGTSTFTPLTPRQAVTPAPHALYAPNAGNALLLNGQSPAAYAPATGSPAYAPATGSPSYVAKAGDTMTGPLNLPANGLVAGATQLALSAGNVGIGTATPAQKLDVVGVASAYGFISDGAPPEGGSLLLRNGGKTGNAAYEWALFNMTGNYGDSFQIWSYAANGSWWGPQFIIRDDGTTVLGPSGGNVGIGTTPTTKLDVNGTVRAAGLTLQGDAALNDHILRLRSDADADYGLGWFGVGKPFEGQEDIDGPVLFGWNGGALGTTMFGEHAVLQWNPWGWVGITGGLQTPDVQVSGTTRTGVLQITGGADVAEPFELSAQDIPKGAVVVIDAENPGRLKLSQQAYDTRVAGIVSGANGVQPGLTLSHPDVVQGGQNVALSGRVYVQAEASQAPIKPGDLLTTSNVPGHAMKVTDHAQAQGAILGKAMSGLKEGQGLVLVLVSLQ